MKARDIYLFPLLTPALQLKMPASSLGREGVYQVHYSEYFLGPALFI